MKFSAIFAIGLATVVSGQTPTVSYQLPEPTMTGIICPPPLALPAQISVTKRTDVFYPKQPALSNEITAMTNNAVNAIKANTTCKPMSFVDPFALNYTLSRWTYGISSASIKCDGYLLDNFSNSRPRATIGGVAYNMTVKFWKNMDTVIGSFHQYAANFTALQNGIVKGRIQVMGELNNMKVQFCM